MKLWKNVNSLALGKQWNILWKNYHVNLGQSSIEQLQTLLHPQVELLLCPRSFQFCRPTCQDIHHRDQVRTPAQCVKQCKIISLNNWTKSEACEQMIISRKILIYIGLPTKNIIWFNISKLVYLCCTLTPKTIHHLCALYTQLHLLSWFDDDTFMKESISCSVNFISDF